jgi:CPA1 family monovalent cation:H+ antiporter
VLGFVWVKSLCALKDPSLIIIAAVLLPWAAYIGGEALHVSGVISTVAAGLMLGWHQHEVFTAAVRLRGTAFWQLVIFLLEALVFILIGLSLRGVIERLGGVGGALTALAIPVLAIVAAVVLSRFAWVFMQDGVQAIVDRISGRRPSHWLRSATVSGWAGMRGVVTLAVALSLPEAMPGRDLILAAAFAVILVTVMVQGTTIGPLIRLLHLHAAEARNVAPLGEEHAIARMAAAQFAVVERLSQSPDGTQKHPRLVEQYGYRARLTERYSGDSEVLAANRREHYEVVLEAIAAGRAEILRLHRSGMIHDEVLRALESDLDLQEIAARAALS